MQFIQIDAQLKRNGENQKSINKSVNVQIIPKISGEMDSYFRLPTQVKIISGMENGEDGLQVEFSGYGSLDESGKRKIGFLFRGPDIQNITPYGKRDEYRFTYADENLKVQLGDDSYSLSELTQMYTYGTGVSVTAVPGKFGLSSYYSRNRWGSSNERQWGSNVMYRVHDNVTMKSNFLYVPSYSGYDTKKIASMEMQYRFLHNNTIEAEYGVNTGKETGNNTAYLVDLNGTYLTRISYNFRKIYAKPNFRGYYNDIDYISGSIVSPLFRRLTWDLNFKENSTNLNLDPAKQSASTNSFFRTGFQYPFSFGTNLSLHYENYHKGDRFLPAAYDYNEKTLIFGVGHSLQNISLNVEIERGKLNDNLSRTYQNLERYRVNAYFRPYSWQTYSVFSIIGHDKYTETPNRSRNIGFSTFWNLTNKEISLNYSKNTYLSNGSIENDTLLSTISYTFRNNHSIIFQTFLSKNGYSHNLRDSYYFIYTMPLNLPIGLKKELGTLKGRIFDEENGRQHGISNAIISVNGLTAVTNSQGSFNFGLVKPGSYQLQVDEKSIGLDKTLSAKTTLKVDIKGGETTEIVIGVVTSCKIRGKVVLFGVDQSKRANILEKAVDYDTDNLEEKYGLGNILVEVKKENEIVRDVTDKKGMFSFDKLKPGTWTVKIYSDNLPDNHYMQDDTRVLELKPGETKEITVKVLPRQRTIRIIDQGIIK